jgi:hypothetical protein
MARRVRCATCGTESRPHPGACWFCGESVVEASVVEASAVETMTVDGSLALPGLRAGDVAASSADPRRVALWNSRLSLGLLAALAVAVCGGAFAISAGLGFTVTLLVAPALVQTSRAVNREAARGRSVSAYAKTGAFVRSLLLGIAARAAGFATFLSITLVALAAGRLLSKMFANEAVMLVFGTLGVCLGIFAGFWVALKIQRQRLSV